MEDSLKNSLLTVCRLLEKYKISYMLVGGIAVALNGYYRHSINISGELANSGAVDPLFRDVDPPFNLQINDCQHFNELA